MPYASVVNTKMSKVSVSAGSALQASLARPRALLRVPCVPLVPSLSRAVRVASRVTQVNGRRRRASYAILVLSALRAPQTSKAAVLLALVVMWPQLLVLQRVCQNLALQEHRRRGRRAHVCLVQQIILLLVVPLRACRALKVNLPPQARHNAARVQLASS